MPEFVCAANDPRWLEERRKGITATDLPVILGLVSWASPYSLWAEKSGITDPAPDNDRFRLGRELEPYISARWLEATGTDRRDIVHGGLRRPSARPWQLATLDYMTIFAGHSGQPIECKSWADVDRHAWDDGPPPAVRAQILWQMDVMDVPRGHWGVLFLPSGEFRHGILEHDAGCDGIGIETKGDCSVCADVDLMRQAGDEFLARVRGELPPPDVDGSAATLAALRARFTPAEGPAAEVSEDLWESWIAAKVFESGAKADAKEAEAKIREIIGTATRIKVGGQIAGRRIIAVAQVKAHERRQDYIRPVNGGNGDE
jgi:putative phage-type endonuclease